MVAVQSSILIDRPIEEVFAYAADYRNDSAWRGEVRDLRYLTPDPIAVGSRELETMVFYGRTTVTESRVSEYDAPRRVAFEYISGPYRVRGSRTFDPDGTGTRFIFALESEAAGGLDRLLTPLLRWLYQRQLDRNVVRLKAILEEGGHPS